jgi:3-hydroxyisobutyrate dehydrogenase
MRIAVIGLGGMGSALAERLLDEGHELEVWNRSPARTEPFADRADVLGDPDAATADAVVVSLADDTSRLEVALPGGAARPAWAGMLVVNASTAAPATQTTLAEAYGASFVAAPILGAPHAVRSGQARWLVGGPSSARSTLAPLWAAFVATTEAGDDPARASVVKLLSNQMLLVGVAMVAETVRLGRAAGLADDELTELLRDSPMLAPGLANRVDGFVDPEHRGWFTGPLAAKDLSHALDLGDASFPVTAAARDAYLAVADAGWADADVTALVELGGGSAG